MWKKIIISTFATLTALAIIFYFWGFNDNNPQIKDILPKQSLSFIEDECLRENEVANYKIQKREKEVSVADIVISDKNTNQEKYRFQIELPIPNHYHPIEIHKCGVYAVRNFNYDFSTKKGLVGYRLELWRYKYNGEGKSLILLSNIPISGNGLGTDFRIDPQEKYLVLEKGYLGKDDYSLVIKNLNTKEDVFVLSAKSVFDKYPNMVGNFGFDKWTNDSRYFWGDIFDGAYVNGFFQIDSQGWKVNIYKAPQDVLGGDALNIENGYITVHPGNAWFGFADMTTEEKEKRRKKGLGTELYIHNLFTGSRHLVDKTDEPLWYFKTKWISDSKLEYTLPNGEKKVYMIPQ